MVGWIPFSLEAVVRTFLAPSRMVGANREQCYSGGVTLSGILTPSGEASGFAEASIDALLVEAGVTGVPEIIRLDLPLETNVKFKPSGDSVKLSVQTTPDLLMTFLSGDFAAFLEGGYPFRCERAEAKVSSWEGPRMSANVFDIDPSIDLEPLQVLQALAGGN